MTRSGNNAVTELVHSKLRDLQSHSHLILDDASSDRRREVDPAEAAPRIEKQWRWFGLTDKLISPARPPRVFLASGLVWAQARTVNRHCLVSIESQHTVNHPY